MSEKKCGGCGTSNLEMANYCEYCGAPFREDIERTTELFEGAFELARCIGEGGMGRVYLAHTRGDSEQKYAVKMLHEHMLKNREAVRRFWREAELMERLDHPNLMPILKRVREKGFYAIVMPYFSNGTLRDILEQQRGEGLPIEKCKHYYKGLLSGLGALHEEGIVHRDIKPSNIMVSNDGTPILCDLGVASLQDGSTRLTRTTQNIGTVLYMAPEQHKGERATKQSDVYAASLILYELLTGCFPFDIDETSSGYKVAEAHIRASPKLDALPHDLPKSFVHLLERALAKEPEERPLDALVLLREFQACKDDVPPPVPRIEPWKMIAVVVALGCMLAGIIFVRQVQRTTHRSLETPETETAQATTSKTEPLDSSVDAAPIHSDTTSIRDMDQGIASGEEALAEVVSVKPNPQDPREGSFEKEPKLTPEQKLDKELDAIERMIDREQYGKAKPRISKIAKNHPNHGRVAALLGRSDVYDDTSRAIREINRAKGLGYNSAEMYLDLATAYFLSGNKGQAKSTYETFLERYPTHKRAGEIRALLKNQFDDGIATNDSKTQSETTSPTKEEAKELRAQANKKVFQGDNSGAISDCKQALRAGESDCHRIMAIAYMKLGKKKEACASFQKALDTNPKNRADLEHQHRQLGCE